jgi:hypothetical protein
MGNQTSLVILVALGGAWSYGLYQLLQQRVPSDSTSKRGWISTSGGWIPTSGSSASDGAGWIPTSYPTPWDPYGFPLESPIPSGGPSSTTQGGEGPIISLDQVPILDPSIPASQGWLPIPVEAPRPIEKPQEPPDTPLDWFKIESRGRYKFDLVELGPLYTGGW